MSPMLAAAIAAKNSKSLSEPSPCLRELRAIKQQTECVVSLCVSMQSVARVV